MPKHEAYGRRHARFAAAPDLTETQGRFATGVQAAPEATVGSADSDQPLGTQLILLLLKVAMVLGFIAMVFLFLFGVVQVGDESMRPAVREGDLVVYYRLQKDYVAGDLIVVDDGDDEEVRRVIAVEGDEVDFSSDGLLINGYLQSETSIYGAVHGRHHLPGHRRSGAGLRDGRQPPVVEGQQDLRAGRHRHRYRRRGNDDHQEAQLLREEELLRSWI